MRSLFGLPSRAGGSDVSLLAWGFCIYAALSLLSMATMSIGAAILGGILLYSLGGPKGVWKALRENHVRSRTARVFFWLSVALTLACAFSLVAASIDPLSYGGHTVDVHFFSDMGKVWYLFWPLVLLAGLQRLTDREKERVIQVWLAVFGVLSVFGVIQHYTGWVRPQVIPDYPSRFHATLFLGHHLSVASIMIFPFFACLDLIRARLGQAGTPRGQPALLGGAAFFGFVTLFLTYSRTLWVALPLGILLWAWLVLPRWGKIVSTVVLVLFSGEALQFPQISERLHNVMGISTREDLWLANWEFAKARPFFGAGWHHNIEASGYYLMEKYHSNDVFQGHAHNNFLDMLGGVGGIGALVWIAWCVGVFWILREGLKNRAAPWFGIGLICAWVVFQINGLTQVNFWESKVLHQECWVIAWSLLWATRKVKS